MDPEKLDGLVESLAEMLNECQDALDATRAIYEQAELSFVQLERASSTLCEAIERQSLGIEDSET